MTRRPPRPTRPDTRFPYTPLFRSPLAALTPFEPADVAFRRFQPVLPGFVHASAFRTIDDTDAEFLELLVAHRRRRVRHQILGLLVHREDDDFADVRLVGEQHHDAVDARRRTAVRSEEHTSELQSLMRNTYAVFCF